MDENRNQNLSISADQLKELISSVVREELAGYNHKCRFSVSDKDAKDFGHFVGMVQEIGDDKLSKGIDIMRDNHKWLYKQRDRSEKISTAVFIFALTLVITGIFTAFWTGMKHLTNK